MSQHGRHSDRITEEAALWFVRAQDSSFSKEDRAELAAWLTGSAEHVREYLSLATTAKDIGELSGTASVDELIAIAREEGDDENVVALLSPDMISRNLELESDASTTKPTERVRRRSVLWATAASLVLAATLSLFYLASTGPTVYSTGVGEQASFPLDDGSVVTLNAQSELRLAYTAGERNVHLVAGEVLFDVAKDLERPFQVITPRATIVAIGTAFNVRHRGDNTTVTVVEGTIEVHSSDLRSGTGSSVPPSGAVPDAVPVRVTVGQQAKVAAGEVAVIDSNVEKATSWRERRLVFDSWALSDVVTEFNLYNDRQFVVNDRKLAERSISGTFSADDRESFALFLSEAGLASSETRDDGTIVLRTIDENP